MTCTEPRPGLLLSHQKTTQTETRGRVDKGAGCSHGSLATGQPRSADRGCFRQSSLLMPRPRAGPRAQTGLSLTCQAAPTRSSCQQSWSMLHTAPHPQGWHLRWGLEPPLQPCKWGKQSPSLAPSREHPWGWRRDLRQATFPPPGQTWASGAGAQAQPESQKTGESGPRAVERTEERNQRWGDCQVSMVAIRLRVCLGKWLGVLGFPCRVER